MGSSYPSHVCYKTSPDTQHAQEQVNGRNVSTVLSNSPTVMKTSWAVQLTLTMEGSS